MAQCAHSQIKSVQFNGEQLSVNKPHTDLKYLVNIIHNINIKYFFLSDVGCDPTLSTVSVLEPAPLFSNTQTEIS